MIFPIQHPHEDESNRLRLLTGQIEPRSLRTFTPSQAVLAHSAGIYHWTPEGRKLYDFSSGVLVANLGHNPIRWTQRFTHYMGWPKLTLPDSGLSLNGQHKIGTPSSEIPAGFFSAVTMTAYNGITPIEVLASQRLLEEVRRHPGGGRLEQVMWAASGSEAIQKALWAAMARDRNRPMILATRFGFHGKKGLAGAVTGSESDHERDPRVKFTRFPMKECLDLDQRDTPFSTDEYETELEAIWKESHGKIGTLITEPYLGGGGSFHPPKAYLQLLQAFCREHDIIFILDEVQSNFGRTGNMFAYETYGLEPDMVVLGKGLGNGVPVAAVVGRSDIFSALDYGEASDTWSANPLCCAAVLATLDEFKESKVLESSRKVSATIEESLMELKQFPFVDHVRGEKGGMVWGVEMKDFAGRSASQWANDFVLACYRGEGEGQPGVHLLGALAKKVIRISPPLVITEKEAEEALGLIHRCLQNLLESQKRPSPALSGVG